MASKSRIPRLPVEMEATSAPVPPMPVKQALAAQSFAQVLPSQLIAQVNRLNVRVAPGANARSLGTVPIGTRFRVHDARGCWVRVSSDELQLSGWVSRNYLGLAKRAAAKTRHPVQRPATPITVQPTAKISTTMAATQLSRDDVVQRIIENSISTYPGRCPCPYNRDRAGRRCGGRSAYNRAGGYAPLCFASDVTAEMIKQFTIIE